MLLPYVTKRRFIPQNTWFIIAKLAKISIQDIANSYFLRHRPKSCSLSLSPPLAQRFVQLFILKYLLLIKRQCSHVGTRRLTTAALSHSTPYRYDIRTYDEMLNYFVSRSTNAFAESFNAKIKAFRAQLRGVTDLKFFFYRLSKLFA